ncbi:MAG: mismatch repair protein MutS2 [Acidobacteriota bacterium]|jgi:DNA mismatch repair protein MutS2
MVETYAPGDRVHVASLGSGVVREVRNRGRYVVDVKGQSVIVTTAQLERAASPRRGRDKQPAALDTRERSAGSVVTLDLHGCTAADAVDALDRFLNDALLAGAVEARIIHGRSGGRVKAAVHARLKQIPGLQGFRLDPRNPGVTIVRL